MNKRILIKKAYRLLENSTPLKFDCGDLCNKRCCSGDNDFGMHLFPGEEELLVNEANFLSIRKEIFNNSEIFFATCNGECKRRVRPLSCRIYPLIPYLDNERRLGIINDPRARFYCSLLLNLDEISIRKSFTRKVRKVFQLLCQDEEILNYINSLSNVLKEYSKFTGPCDN